MAYTYRKKAVNNINQRVTASSGASFAQQHANNYDKQLSSVPAYNGGAYASRISQIADDILNNRKDYSFGGEEAMSKFAMDYSALSGLGVAGAKADADKLSGGYANYGSQAVADQYRSNYVNPLEQMEAVQNIAQSGKQNQLDVGGILNNANDAALEQHQNRINAMQNGRDTMESLYQSLYGTDIDMSNARQTALNNLMGIENDLNYGKDKLKQELLEANQDYELALLADLATKKSGSGSGGRSGRRSGRKSSAGSGYDYNYSDDTSSNNGKSNISTKEILALGYGPISKKKLESLIKSGDVETYSDKKGKLHVRLATSNGNDKSSRISSRIMFGADNLKSKQKTETINGKKLPKNTSAMNAAINTLMMNSVKKKK